MGLAFRILHIVRPFALRIRYAGPASPINTRKEAALAVPFTSLPQREVPCPDRGAASSIAKPVAALVVLRATALRHVLRPGACRFIPPDRLIDRRKHERSILSATRPSAAHASPSSAKLRLATGDARRIWFVEWPDLAIAITQIVCVMQLPYELRHRCSIPSCMGPAIEEVGFRSSPKLEEHGDGRDPRALHCGPIPG